MNSSIRQVRRAGWVGLLCNLLLAAIKVVAGILGHSQAVLADALHSLTDSVTDVAVILGVHFWSAPADDDHPHGHGRIETLVTVVIGLSVGLVALGMGWQSIHGMRLGQVAEAPAGIALAAALMSIAIKEGLYQWTVKIGRRVQSPALIANAWHHRSDAISSIPAALAVAVALLIPGWEFIDRVGAIVVCGFILQASWKILGPALNQLIDAAAPQSDQRFIEELATSVDGVESAHAVRTRYVGAKLAVEIHIGVDGGLSVGDGHAIAKAVRQSLIENGPNVDDVVVQLEPYRLRSPE
jgi:cation diffusion facilitator family transporter